MSNPYDPMERAARLPLKDAAYLLWSKKSQLDYEERTATSTPKPPVDLSEAAVERAMREALAKVSFDRDNAHYGPTFFKLKKAHLDAADDDIRAAIQAAVKLDTDCVRYFSYEGVSLSEPVRKAVSRARMENPGFLDSTYELAEWDLATAMR